MRNIPNIDPSKALYPHEYFDLIGGTSTGGLVALMLGRFGMDIESAIKKYEELGSITFGRDRGQFLGVVVRGAAFDVAPFERELVAWLKDEYMLDSDLGSHCRVSPCYLSPGRLQEI
jgi:patatin-like phospholipase/acyl hydrolase